jgi:hypothetical protein
MAFPALASQRARKALVQQEGGLESQLFATGNSSCPLQRSTKNVRKSICESSVIFVRFLQKSECAQKF